MAKRRNNGERDASGRRKRNPNGCGTVFKNPTSRYYLARWKIGDKYHTETTGCEDLEAARAYLKKRTEDLALAHEDKILDRILEKKDSNAFRLQQMEKEKAEAAKRQAALEPAMTLMEGFRYYLNSAKRPDSGASTLEGYECQYNKFVDWMSKTHPNVKEIRGVTVEIAEEFAQYLRKTYSRNRHNKYIRFLRTFWKVMRWESYARIIIDPWDGIKSLVQSDSRPRKPLTIEELRRVCGSARGELRILLAIGVYTGLRLKDCVTLGWGNVDLDRRLISCMPAKTARKYKRWVYMPIHPRLQDVLEEIPTDQRKGPIVPDLSEKYSRNSSLVSRLIQRHFKDAGLETQEKDNQTGRTHTRVGFHSLRHTFASILANNYVPPIMISKMLGHSHESMTEHYYHANVEVLRDGVYTIPDIDAGEERKSLPLKMPVSERSMAFRQFLNAISLMSKEELRQGREILMNRISA